MLGERNDPTSHGKLFMIHVFDWLYETPWSVRLPKRIEVCKALQVLRPLARRSTPMMPPPYVADKSLESQLIVSAWSHALYFVVNLLLRIIDVLEEPFDANNSGYAPITWNPPWVGETLEIGPNKKLVFIPKKDPMIELYGNFRRALIGADAGRIRICHATYRGDVECGRFYWAKVGRQKACSPKCAQLMRAKKWLKSPKGREYYELQLKKTASTTDNDRERNN
jgi:hypothetical protein